MEPLLERCAGLDVHKKTVVACCITPKESGGWRVDTRTFGTTTGSLLILADWLRASSITHVAMDTFGDGSVLETHLQHPGD
jgi:hypothetical protein